jgi:hypothetical protein
MKCHEKNEPSKLGKETHFVFMGIVEVWLKLRLLVVALNAVAVDWVRFLLVQRKSVPRDAFRLHFRVQQKQMM